MTPEVFTHQDIADTIVGISKRIASRETLLRVPMWQDVVRSTADFAFSDLYGFLPEDREEFPDFFEFRNGVENVMIHEGTRGLEDLIPLGASHEEAGSFGAQFEVWRDQALGAISSEDESPELRDSVLTAMSLDMLASLVGSRVEKICEYLKKDEISFRNREFWDQQLKEWSFRKEFVEIARRISIVANAPTL